MTKFSDLNLNPKVLKAIEEAGYETPTPIQAGAIPPALDGRDVLGIAQTGTGKTAGFVLPMITLLARGRARARMPRSLVLCPTRELAAQVAENFDTYTKHLKLTKALLIGGVSFKEQDTLIDKGVDVLIATPGRLLDHFERGKLILSDVKVMVVDEADRMLDMGFIPDIERIFGLTPFTRQTLFFSATMAPEIERITNTFLSNPARIEVARQASASETIEQGVVMFKGSRKDREASEKRKVLRMLIDAEGDKCTNAIIFCNRKTDVDIVAKSLNKYGYDAAPIHGDLDQSQRTRTLDGFRAGTLRFLVASDVAARGLDVPSVSHVFNFDVPSHAEDYVHRIGRTGRAGRDGKAVMICVPRDEKNFEDIERLIQREIPRIENPLGHIGAEAQGDAPEDTTEKKPTSSRSRSRSRSRKTDDAPKADAPAQTKPEAAPKQAETPKRDAAPAETRAEPQKDTRADNRSDNRNDTPDSKRSSSSRSRSNRDDRGGRVTGLGDHTPTFIEKSFAERYDS
ncbi:Superfamily II DNA and RNA helicase [Pseudosulfitobacter pseudonitzschiae]|uniref:DEAD-box ATP-dependent RNA helicase RhpA n=1 Tax=Pseudosulfitobacter pseudonitzschiae TaxID=1402135 RepID=A0A073J834_9RHOB|nr:DEAD/DEAH box helicase [Pseudosulfitobacter pseudonitzschiae]KEJ97965.1 DEAD/DEAH box helicase [Pseudosulfitobacter pseudonitzschiae]QKS09218.1 DEAD/DEAH box helicase [Pseudosulfitobacter pseudonitzschiae]SHE51695.1 Superfamily II DNA and RNA helicase [Pseudosulfitobacter pseudonitzschiae]